MLDESVELQELGSILARLLPLLSAAPESPSATPRPGQTSEQWCTEVARLRAQHDAMTLEATRLAGLTPEPLPVASVSWERVGEASGRRYAPAGPGPHPAIAVLHGGSWWMGGGAAGYALLDVLCRLLCQEAGVVVLNLDYRMPPEHPFPRQIDDAIHAVRWLGSDPCVDPDRIGLLGMSSGGSTSAAAALQPDVAPLAGLLLLSPSLDMTGSSPSFLADPAGRSASMERRRMYVQDTVPFEDPRVSPVLAEDLTCLPPTTVIVGTVDPLQDDGRRFAARVAQAGVPVALHVFPMAHAIATPRVTEAYTQVLVEAARAL